MTVMFAALAVNLTTAQKTQCGNCTNKNKMTITKVDGTTVAANSQKDYSFQYCLVANPNHYNTAATRQLDCERINR